MVEVTPLPWRGSTASVNPVLNDAARVIALALDHDAAVLAVGVTTPANGMNLRRYLSFFASTIPIVEFGTMQSAS